MKILLVFGTRPEAIKLAPLILHLQSLPHLFRPVVCVTAQHRELLDGALARFGITPAHDLSLMRPNQSLAGITARVLESLDPVLEDERPALVLVQGDTTTAFAGALAAFYRRIPVGHVEAGLRTYNYEHPFPEEVNRVLVARLASLHFAPTRQAADALLREGVAPASIHVTGNTGIDALLYTRGKLETGEWPGLSGLTLAPGRPVIAVTAHRRESFGPGFESLCRAFRQLAEEDGAQIVYPVHPNPNVRSVAYRLLRGVPGIHLLEPLDYVSFIDLFRRADLILTDSGGVQEEAPSLEKPVLILRETTERPEVLETGWAELVGTSQNQIVARARAHLRGSWQRPVTGVANPFGDGRASERISTIIHSFLST